MHDLEDEEDIGFDPSILEEKDREADAVEAAAIKRGRSKRKALARAGIALAVVLVGGGVFGVITLDPFGNAAQPTSTGQPAPGTAAESDEPTKKTLALTPKSFWEEDGKAYPVPSEPWQLAPAPEAPTAEALAPIEQRYAATSLHTAALTLPSEASGFTSAMDQQFDGDGNINPKWSYWTQETFTRDTGLILEKFVNPKFGEWELPQYDAAGFSAVPFESLFTPEWWAAHSGTPKDFPVYADWNGDAYGLKGTLLDGGTRWMGSVTDVEAAFTFDDSTQLYSVDLTAAVTYTAWTQDQKTTTREGTLKLMLVTPSEAAAATSSTRTLVSDASLEVR